METTTNFDRTIHLGTVKEYPKAAEAFARIRYESKPKGMTISITGVVGPKRNGDASGSCGQVNYREHEFTAYATGWSADLVERFADAWDRWHLNDMRAGCEHQRSAGWGSKSLEVVTYGLNSTAWDIKRAAEKEAMDAAIEGRVAELDDAQKFLIGPNWHQDRFSPPDADSPLSGLYDVKKRETKMSNWVREDEHPDGELSKACPVCGYKYGSAWLFEEAPADVVEFLRTLPAGDITPAWA